MPAETAHGSLFLGYTLPPPGKAKEESPAPLWATSPNLQLQSSRPETASQLLLPVAL